MKSMLRTGSYRICKQFPVRRLVIATLAAELQLILSHAPASFSQADRHSLCCHALPLPLQVLPTLSMIFRLAGSKSSATRTQ
jgi:hypothetical protein